MFLTNNKKYPISKIITYILITVLIFGLLSIPLKNFYTRSLNLIITSYINTHQTVSHFIDNHFYQKKIIEQQRQYIDKLEQKVDHLTIQNKLLHSNFSHNQHLRKLLNLKKETLPRSVVANVILRSPNTWFRELTIDKGSNHGIKIGSVVVGEKGILGQIQSVHKNHSIVKLLSSKQIRFGAEVQRSSVAGIIVPTDQINKAYLKFVPIGSDIKVGDIMQTKNIQIKNLSSIFPPHYPIGKVISVNQDTDNSELIVLIDLFENASTINQVLILKS